MLCDEGLPKSSYASGVWYKLWPIPMKPPVTGALARQERRPGSSPLFRQGAFVMSDAMSENVAKLIAILATFSRTGHNQAAFDFSGNAD